MAETLADLPLPLPQDEPFYRRVLNDIGAPRTNNNLLTLYAWRQSEGGTATYNPLNTSWFMPGSTVYNSHGVKNYLTPEDGVHSTVKTLLMPEYAAALAVLREDRPMEDLPDALAGTGWGTKTTLLRNVIAMYRRGRVVSAPIATRPGAPPISDLTTWQMEPLEIVGDPPKAVSYGGGVLFAVGLLAIAAYWINDYRQRSRQIP